MKKLLIFLTAATMLTACAQNNESPKDSKPAAETVADKTDELNSDVANLGTVKEIYFDEAVNLTKKNGPAKITIKELRVLDIDMDEQYVDMYKGIDVGHIIALTISTKNTSKKPIYFTITDSKILVNGEQKIAEHFNNEYGEIVGGATVESEVYFMLKGDVSKVDTLTWYADRPSNSATHEYIGDKNLEWQIKLNK